jgi:hypothetical protein
MRKLTYDEVKAKFEEVGWRVLSTEYTGSQQPLSVTCPNDHETTITWNNFQRGQGCKHCAGNVKYDIEFVRQVFNERGCELFTGEYKNNVSPLHYRCHCGNITVTRFNEFIKGRGCQNCKAQKLSKMLSTPDEEISKFCNEHGAQFIRSWSQQKRTRIEYICKCGDLAEAYWTNFKRFPNCKKCGNKKVSGPNCHMYDPDREAVALRKKFRKTCGRLLRRALLATGQQKNGHTYKILGYTPQQLQDRILNHPDYAKCGAVYHIDHIFPIQAFLDHGILDLKLINDLDNLRPMPGSENLSKADKYDEKEFVEWLRNKSL